MQPRQLSLHCLRELDYPRRIQWLNALDRTDLQFLAAYHCAKTHEGWARFSWFKE